MTNIPQILGGYNIIKLKPLNYGVLKGKISHSCSSCINFSIFDSWFQSWTKQDLDETQKKELNLSDEKIKDIQKWTESKYDNLANLFRNLQEAKEFKNLFLKSVPNLEIYSINFSEKDANLLIEEFAENVGTENYNYNKGDFVLRKNLLNSIPENQNEKFLGFDIIGIECDGSFHSFLCNNASNKLKEKFGLDLNEFGLYDEIEDTDELRKFLTNEDYFEPVPYYICKVKKVVE